jgi:hypothetical protein
LNDIGFLKASGVNSSLFNDAFVFAVNSFIAFNPAPETA